MVASDDRRHTHRAILQPSVGNLGFKQKLFLRVGLCEHKTSVLEITLHAGGQHLLPLLQVLPVEYSITHSSLAAR